MSRFLKIAGAVALAGGVGYAGYRWYQGRKGEEETMPVDDAIDLGDVSMVDRERLFAAEQAAQIPGLAVFLAVVGAGESNWKASNPWAAHNLDKQETDASRDAYLAGVKAGLPAMAHAEEVKAFGSGGAFALIAPYALWSGRPSRPLLNEAPDILFDPATSLACAADTVVRLAAYKQVTSWRHVRVAWAALKIVKNDPSLTSEKAQAVLARMVKRTTEQGLAPLLPRLDAKPDVSKYPGLPMVLDRLRGP